jgi:hypothetical protein
VSKTRFQHDVRDRTPKDSLMKISTKSRPTSTKKPSRDKSEPVPATPPASVPRPGGKLGVILDRLATKKGAPADELVSATGWQRHSVLGALSRLRSRGFTIRLNVDSRRKAYRLNASRG